MAKNDAYIENCWLRLLVAIGIVSSVPFFLLTITFLDSSQSKISLASIDSYLFSTLSQYHGLLSALIIAWYLILGYLTITQMNRKEYY
jgi:hypothetical protein